MSDVILLIGLLSLAVVVALLQYGPLFATHILIDGCVIMAWVAYFLGLLPLSIQYAIAYITSWYTVRIRRPIVDFFVGDDDSDNDDETGDDNESDPDPDAEKMLLLGTPVSHLKIYKLDGEIGNGSDDDDDDDGGTSPPTPMADSPGSN